MKMLVMTGEDADEGDKDEGREATFQSKVSAVLEKMNKIKRHRMLKYGVVQLPIYHFTVCLLLKWLQRMNVVAIIEIPLCNKTVNVSCQKSI